MKISRVIFALFALLVANTSFADMPQEQRTATQALMQKKMLESLQIQKIEREMIAEKCTSLNPDFGERFKKSNAEWEVENAKFFKNFAAMLGMMGTTSSMRLYPPSGIDTAQLIKSLTDQSAPSALPVPDNLAQLTASAETKIALEMEVLSRAEQYGYCLQMLGKPSVPSRSGDASAAGRDNK